MNFHSLKEHFRLLTQSRPLPLEKPKVVQFPVIDICNSRCQMCRIWENKQSTDISVDQLRKGLNDELFSNVESIGFNGGEPTLRKDLPELVQVTVDSLPRLKSVSLITNAYKYEQVIKQIDSIGHILKSKCIAFDVMVSLDGYGNIHDIVRGREGNFNRAQKVINFIKSSPLVDSVRIGCTVIRENVYYLSDLLDYCIQNDLYIKYRLGVPHQRLYTEKLVDPYALTFEEKYEFVEFLEGIITNYESDTMQNFFYRSLIEQIINGSARRAGCAWQHKGVTITARGELAYCAVKSKVLSEAIWRGSQENAYFDNQDHLKDIIRNECDSCHHDYVGDPSRKDYQKLFLQKIDDKFNLKSTLKNIPGFNIINFIRCKRRFNLNIHNYRQSVQNIRVVDAHNNDKVKSKSILICGWYGTETLGDKAIVAAILNVLRKEIGATTKFMIASLHPYVTAMTKKQMRELEEVEILSIDAALRVCTTVDYVVFGGGPLMAIDPIAPMEVIFERARSAGVITIAGGVGVGPFGADYFNKSIFRLLSNCDIRIYRDSKSRNNAIELGIDTNKDLVAEDPAFTWLRGFSNESQNRKESGAKTLLLGLRDFPYNEYASELTELEAQTVKKHYESTIIEVIRDLASQNEKLIVKPLPMCTNHFGGDDRWFYRRIFRSITSLGGQLDYSLLGPEKPPIHYVKEFQNANALLAMRFHSLVFGIAFGVNSVAIDYTMGRGKVHSLAVKNKVPMFSMLNLEASSLSKALQNALWSRECTPFKEELLFEGAISSQLKKHSELRS